MKRNMFKKLVCDSGLLFMTFPAWSAVPSNLFPTDGGWCQSSVSAYIASKMIEDDVMLAKGSGGGGGAGAGGGGGAGAGGDGGNGG